MTRKEEIINYSNSFKGNGMENEELKEIIRLAIIDGAMWSDENPDEKMIAKYLYEKKGYPTDLNGNLPSFDETMKDAEKYLKYKQDKFIEKAKEWFIEHINIPQDIETNEDGEPLADSYIKYAKERLNAANEMFENFKTYMEGE